VNNLKFGVLACGLTGLVGSFMPFLNLRTEAVGFFDLRGTPGGTSYVLMIMAGYVAALIVGAMAATKPPILRWQSIVAIVGFAWAGFKLNDGMGGYGGGFIELITDGEIGAKVMAISAVAGLAFAILCIVKPEPAT
jgi:hypothetical protein